MSQPTQELQRLARGGSGGLAGLVYYGAANFAAVVVVTRGVGARQAGAFFVAVAAFSILVRSTQLGADIGMVRTVSSRLVLARGGEIPRMLRIALGPVAVCSTAGGLLLFVFARPLAELLAPAMADTVLACLRVVALAVPVAAVYQVLESTSRGYSIRASVGVEKIGRVTLQLAGIVLVVALGGGPVAITVAWAAPFLAGLVAIGVWIRSMHRSRVPRSMRRGARTLPPRARSDFWRFAGSRAPAATFQAAVLWSDTLILAALTTTAKTGIYSAATRYMTIGAFAQVAISQAILPIFSRLNATDDLDAANGVYRTGSAWLIALTWPLFLTTAIFATPLLRLFGPAFVVADAALAILSVGWLVATGCGPVDNVLLMAGRGGWTSVNTGIGLALNIGLNLWLVPRYGIAGAATAWSASLIWMNVVPLLQVHATLHMNPFGRAWLPAAFGAVAVFGGLLAVGRFTIGASGQGLVVSLAVAVPLYGAYVWVLRRPLQLDAFSTVLRRRGARNVEGIAGNASGPVCTLASSEKSTTWSQNE